MTTRHDSNGASDVITPPAMLGVLGGGQLGRYFVLAARTMGYRTTVLEPDPGSPAGAVADVHLVAAYDDPAALEQLAATCAVVTTEFENAPAEAMAQLAARIPVRPSPAALATTQDRIAEKQFLDDIGVGVAPYVVIVTDADLADAAGFSFPAILKTARLGYDGKGQCRHAVHVGSHTGGDQLLAGFSGRDQHLATHVTALLDRRQLVFEVHTTRASADHGLHQFVGVQHATETGFRVSDDRSVVVDITLVARANAFGPLDFVRTGEGVIDTLHNLWHRVHRVQRLVGVHGGILVVVGGDLPAGQVDGLDISLDLLHRLATGQRAQSVANYLGSQHGIAEKRLAVEGMGRSQLAVADQPYSALNRRVQVINLGQP